MKGDFFIRASILHLVDTHISGARGLSTERKQSIPQHIEFPEGSVFQALQRCGVHAEILGKIYDLYEKFNFRQVSSVGEKIRWYAKSDHERIYDLLREVNLYDHCVRVAQNALLDEEIAAEQRKMVALFGLLHDIGKSKELCAHYGVDADRHELAGAELIEALLSETAYEKAGELFSEDLRRIAAARDEGYQPLGMYGERMHHADKLAREQELRMIQRRRHGQQEVQ